MAGNRHVVIVDEHFDIQFLGDTKARRFGIVALHLAAVGAQHHDRLAGVGHRDAIDEGPQVSQATGAEFHARREQLFRMPGQSAVVLAIMQQLFRRHGAIQDAQQVLGRHTVARLVIEHRHNGAAIGDKRPDDHELRHRVVGTAGMSGQPLGSGEGRKENNRIARQLNVVLKRGPLLIAQGRLAWVELQRLQAIQINWKAFIGHCRLLVDFAMCSSLAVAILLSGEARGTNEPPVR